MSDDLKGNIKLFFIDIEKLIKQISSEDNNDTDKRDDNKIPKNINTYSILGERGTGKSSVLSCIYDELNNKHNNKNQHLIVLPIVDPCILEKDNFLGWLIGLLDEKLQRMEQDWNSLCILDKHKYNEKNHKPNYNEKYKNHFKFNCIEEKFILRKRYDEVIKQYVQVQNEYKNIIGQEYTDYEKYETNYLDILKSDVNLKNKFNLFIEELLSFNDTVKDKDGRPSKLVIIIDDLDLSPSKCTEILKVILNFLNHDRIITILAGDYNVFLNRVYLDILKRDNLLDTKTLNTKFNELTEMRFNLKTVIKEKEKLAVSFINKVMPTSKRYFMNSITNANIDNFKPLNITNSDYTMKNLLNKYSEDLSNFTVIFSSKPRWLVNMYEYFNQLNSDNLIDLEKFKQLFIINNEKIEKKQNLIEKYIIIEDNTIMDKTDSFVKEIKSITMNIKKIDGKFRYEDKQNMNKLILLTLSYILFIELSKRSKDIIDKNKFSDILILLFNKIHDDKKIKFMPKGLSCDEFLKIYKLLDGTNDNSKIIEKYLVFLKGNIDMFNKFLTKDISWAISIKDYFDELKICNNNNEYSNDYYEKINSFIESKNINFDVFQREVMRFYINRGIELSKYAFFNNNEDEEISNIKEDIESCFKSDVNIDTIIDLYDYMKIRSYTYNRINIEFKEKNSENSKEVNNIKELYEVYLMKNEVIRLTERIKMVNDSIEFIEEFPINIRLKKDMCNKELDNLIKELNSRVIRLEAIKSKEKEIVKYEIEKLDLDEIEKELINLEHKLYVLQSTINCGVDSKHTEKTNLVVLMNLIEDSIEKLKEIHNIRNNEIKAISNVMDIFHNVTQCFDNILCLYKKLIDEYSFYADYEGFSFQRKIFKEKVELILKELQMCQKNIIATRNKRLSIYNDLCGLIGKDRYLAGNVYEGKLKNFTKDNGNKVEIIDDKIKEYERMVNIIADKQRMWNILCYSILKGEKLAQKESNYYYNNILKFTYYTRKNKYILGAKSKEKILKETNKIKNFISSKDIEILKYYEEKLDVFFSKDKYYEWLSKIKSKLDMNNEYIGEIFNSIKNVEFVVDEGKRDYINSTIGLLCNTIMYHESTRNIKNDDYNKINKVENNDIAITNIIKMLDDLMKESFLKGFFESKG